VFPTSGSENAVPLSVAAVLETLLLESVGALGAVLGAAAVVKLWTALHALHSLLLSR
jgi:hypothetical protein